MIEIYLQKALNAATGPMTLEVAFSLDRGDFVTLYGPSGVGKTSVLRMIAGLMKPDQGRIHVHGKDWYHSEESVFWKPQQRSVGLVFQDYALFPNMTVRENLVYALEKGDDLNVVENIIELIELGDLQSRKPDTLSGGQQQRVALARALVRKPDILMLDEPLSALDLALRQKLQDYILELHQTYRLTTIMVSHEHGEITKMSNRVLLMEAGKIVRQGTPLEVFSTKSLSGKFQFTGVVMAIDPEDVVFVITVLVGQQLVKVIAEEKTAGLLQVGDKVVVASKAFNPIIQKIQ